MFAVQHKQFGTARDVLHIVHDAPVPEVGPNDILVRVWATSINPIDCAIRSGYGLAFWESVGAVKKSHIPGHDVAGEVVKAGREFQLVATNKLEEDISSSPAISGGTLYLRSFAALYAIRNVAGK